MEFLFYLFKKCMQILQYPFLFHMSMEQSIFFNRGLVAVLQ